MSLSPAIQSYLQHSHIDFDIIEHRLSHCALQTAHLTHIDPNKLAKAVVVRDRDFYLLCVLPSCNQIIMPWLNREFSRAFELAKESELPHLLPDFCDGAVPVLGNAYGLQVTWDRALTHINDVYLEAGDHRHIIHVTKHDFQILMADANLSSISCAAEAMDIYRHIH